MRTTTTFVCLAMGTALVTSFNEAANAQSPAEIAELRSAGFEHIGNGVWKSVDADGVERRAGFGIGSEQALLDRLDELHQKGFDAGVGSGPAGAITDLHVSIAALKERQPDTEKGSGNFGPCVGIRYLPSTTATIELSTMTASAQVGASSLPPYGGSYIRIAAAFAGPADHVSIQGTVGPDGPPSEAISVGITGLLPSTCRFYSYAHSYDVVNGCGQWTDAVYNGVGC